MLDFTFAFDADLEPWLLPLQFLNSTKNLDDFLYVRKKIHNDSYKGALKYLRFALNSTPPIYEALLPLVQVLVKIVIGNDMNSAKYLYPVPICIVHGKSSFIFSFLLNV